MQESDDDAGGAGLSYGYKPSLMAPPWEFRLLPDAMAWQYGRRSGRVAYGRIRRIRLSFRPLTLQSHRFITEIWPEQGGKLLLSSSSWKSVLEQERLDDGYVAFVRELHRRLPAGGVAFDMGAPPVVYWCGFVVFAAASLGLAALTVRGLQVDAWAGAAFVGGFLALFLWQLGGYFRRNRPGRYAADALPADLLPRSGLSRTTSTEHGA